MKVNIIILFFLFARAGQKKKEPNFFVGARKLFCGYSYPFWLEYRLKKKTIFFFLLTIQKKKIFKNGVPLGINKLSEEPRGCRVVS